MRSARILAPLALVPAIAALITACMSAPSGTGDAADASTPTPSLDATTVDAVGIGHVSTPYDGAAINTGVARTPVSAETISTRVDTQQLMFAAGEMQISGEPFAEFFAGRNLNNYDRTFLPTNQYLVPFLGDAGFNAAVINDGTFGEVLPVTDLFGFGTAVESYEYSKYHMNMVLQQTTAGIALSNGPTIAARSEATPLARMQGRATELLTSAGTGISGYAQLPIPPNNPLNYLGFQGLWPEFFPFADFDPTITPSHEVVKTCTFSGGYGGIPTVGSTLPEFECAYNLLHLPSRDTQVNKTLVPAVLGFTVWKASLWSIDFAGRLHDSRSNPVTQINPSDAPLVGTGNNTVLALDPGAVPGTFLGSTPLEDMWGLMMIEEVNNAAEFALDSFTTSDGVALGGFASKVVATGYDYTSPFRWFPASVALVEDESVVPFPAIQTLTINDATSRSLDLASLLLGYSMYFGMTDPRNVGVGQRIGMLLTFDGAPFPADDGVADGEDTPHDRALSVLRVAFVDLDRAHTVQLANGNSVTVDTATVAAGVPTPGSTVTTTTLAHEIIALRQTLLSLNGAITQYGAADPDPSADLLGILNAPPIHPTAKGGATTMSPRVRQLFLANATFVRDVLTKSDGTVANGATIAGGVATATPGVASLETQAAAVRALIEAFLVTGDATFYARAQAVTRHLQSAFYSPTARMFRQTEGGADDIVLTPERFAWLLSALRETHKTLQVAGDPALDRTVLEDLIERSIKLYLNGWDDLNGDQAVQLPGECMAARMQMGEQALTGELGRDAFGKETTDRDQDCVPEIDSAELGSVLASQVHYHAP